VVTLLERLIQIRWSDGVRCCDCGSVRCRQSADAAAVPVVQGFFPAKKGTVKQPSKIGVCKWLVAIYLMTTNLKSVSSGKLARDLGITKKSAWQQFKGRGTVSKTASSPS